MKEGYGIGGREPVGTDDGRSILLTSGMVVAAAVAASSAVVVPSATASSVTAMMRRRHFEGACDWWRHRYGVVDDRSMFLFELSVVATLIACC